jgi:ABC-type Mn2+/Zn2+ transport system ATPase subunit
VVVGKFLLTGARLLLLYDLTRGVDVGTKAEIFKTVQNLANDGYGVLFYSSDITELANVPHRVVVMFDGRVTADYPAGAFTQEELVAAMVGQGARPGQSGDTDLVGPGAASVPSQGVSESRRELGPPLPGTVMDRLQWGQLP